MCSYFIDPVVFFSLVMPLVCKDMVDILDIGVNSTSANHTSLSNFAFLYGVFPTAPSVAIYAAHYNMELEVVSPYLLFTNTIMTETFKMEKKYTSRAKKKDFPCLFCWKLSSFKQKTCSSIDLLT